MKAFSYLVKEDEFLIALELRHSDGICRTQRTGHKISFLLGYQTIFSVIIKEFTWWLSGQSTGPSGRCLKPVYCVSDIKADNKDVLYEMYSITLNAEFRNMGQAIASIENPFQNLFEHFISCHFLVTTWNQDRGPIARIKCDAAVCYFMHRVRVS
jgi:hypothetical protein